MSVGLNASFAAVAIGLNGTCFDDAVADRGGAFDFGIAAELFVFHGGTSMWMSMRTRGGPEFFEAYR
jgi:hypothetical protein